jgi:hypothetical protein
MIRVYFSRRSEIFLVNLENGKIMRVGHFCRREIFFWLFRIWDDEEGYGGLTCGRELEDLFNFYGEVIFEALTLIDHFGYNYGIHICLIKGDDFSDFSFWDDSNFVNDILDGFRDKVYYDLNHKFEYADYVKFSYFLGKDIGSNWINEVSKID